MRGYNDGLLTGLSLEAIAQAPFDVVTSSTASRHALMLWLLLGVRIATRRFWLSARASDTSCAWAAFHDGRGPLVGATRPLG